MFHKKSNSCKKNCYIKNCTENIKNTILESKIKLLGWFLLGVSCISLIMACLTPSCFLCDIERYLMLASALFLLSYSSRRYVCQRYECQKDAIHTSSSETEDLQKNALKSEIGDKDAMLVDAMPEDTVLVDGVQEAAFQRDSFTTPSLKIALLCLFGLFATSLYHIFIQFKLIDSPSVCKIKTLTAKRISCSDKTANILNLPLPVYVAILALLSISLIIYWIKFCSKKDAS